MTKLDKYNIKKNNEIRIKKIKELKNPIIRKLILNLKDDEDNIDEKKYINEFTSFLSTMKLPKMEIKYIENSTTETTTWQSSISIKLNFKKTISIADGLDECCQQRMNIAEKIRAWAAGNPAARVCVLSRPVGYSIDLLPPPHTTK